MSRVGLSLIAPDEPGIVATVLAELLERRWSIGQITAETRFDTFFLAIELTPERFPGPIELRRRELERFLESKGWKAVVRRYDEERTPRPTDFVADITIEGSRRVDIFVKTVNAVAKERASIKSVRTEVVEGELRYVVQAEYDDTRGMRHALLALSEENNVEFVSEAPSDLEVEHELG